MSDGMELGRLWGGQLACACGLGLADPPSLAKWTLDLPVELMQREGTVARVGRQRTSRRLGCPGPRFRIEGGSSYESS